jgi:hypothetical protein
MKYTNHSNSTTSRKMSNSFSGLGYPTPQKEELSICPESWSQLISSTKELVLVVWEDAYTHGGPGWTDTEDVLEILKKKKCPDMKTVGHLLKREEGRIILTDTLGPEESGSIHVIPSGMIKEIHRLSIEEE